MKKGKVIFLFIFGLSLALLSSEFTFGIPPKKRPHHPKPEKLQEVLREINLTRNQKFQIAQITKQTKQKVEEIENQIDEIRKQDVEILKQYPPNKEQSLANQEKIADLLKQIHLIRAKAFLEILSVLDENQYRCFLNSISIISKEDECIK